LQLSAEPALQVPDWQVSAPLQVLPSEQEVPLATGPLVQPVAGSQASAVQALLSLQLSAAPAIHVPAWQVSAPLQALPSEQEFPSAFGGLEQTPVDGLHVPATWHWSEAVQAIGLPPEHTPAWQVSAWVQALPSLQALPSALGEFEQTPVDGLHVATWHWSEAVQVTGLAPVHTPAWQESVWVQALPSLQALPSALGGFEQRPVDGEQTPASWHWSEAVQMIGLAPVHVPAWQVSLWVQALPSLQAVPLALGELEQTPVDGLHVATSHWSGAVQVTGLAPVHTPARHVSVCVQALSSLQAVPSALGEPEQVPVDGSQAATWHWSPAVQTTGSLPAHTPAWQVSVWVQALPSLQAAPSALGELEQTPFDGLQVATWHWSETVQVTGLLPVHTPAWQVSVWVQALPSSQAVPSAFPVQPVAPPHEASGVWTQPVAELHESIVQTLPSLQLAGGPPTQAPLLQVSLAVQALPSLQEAALLTFRQPSAWSQESVVQTLPSSQVGGGPPTHAPLLQVSLAVQELPSLQESVLLACWQPSASSQRSVVHGLPSSHSLAVTQEAAVERWYTLTWMWSRAIEPLMHGGSRSYRTLATKFELLNSDGDHTLPHVSIGPPSV
jgi:hypothetical protein